MIKNIILATLVAFGLVGCSANIENGTPEEIAEYVFIEAIKGNKSNYMPLLDDEISELSLKKIVRGGSYYLDSAKDPAKWELKIVRSNEKASMVKIEVYAKNKTAIDESDHLREYRKDYDAQYTFEKQDGKWKISLVY